MILRIKDGSGRVILEMKMMPGYEVSILFSDNKEKSSTLVEENDKTIIDLEEKKKELMKVKPQAIPVEKYEAEKESVKSVKDFRSQVEEEIAAELEGLISSTGGDDYMESKTDSQAEEGETDESSTEIMDDLLSDSPADIVPDEVEEGAQKRKVKKEEKAKEILAEILDFNY